MTKNVTLLQKEEKEDIFMLMNSSFVLFFGRFSADKKYGQTQSIPGAGCAIYCIKHDLLG